MFCTYVLIQKNVSSVSMSAIDFAIRQSYEAQALNWV